jgi:spore maturation protein CgeB
MRILIAGEWQAEIHEAAWQRGLEDLGHEVLRFGWFDRFAAPQGRLARLSARVQNKLLLGPHIGALNSELLEQATAQKPDAIVFYRPTHVLANTARQLGRGLPRCVLVTFNNDDAFSPRASKLLWRHYLELVRVTDLNLAYRSENLADLRAAGARGVHLLRSYYLPWRDRPLPVTAQERARLGADVLFAGHYEDDGRVDSLVALATSGLNFKLFGPDWGGAPRVPSLELFRPISPLRGTDYVKAISSSKIALCLFSKLNRDTYTRRVFEIPAIGAALLCERTDDMRSLYLEGVEAEYFATPQELVSKARAMLANADALKAMIHAGQARAARSGYDLISRMRELEGMISAARSAKE